jgi:tetratricopeptide (TPR) repeat protein
VSGIDLDLWQAFPHPEPSYEYADEQLASAWNELHRGDREPFPDENRVTELLRDVPQAAPPDFTGDITALATALQSAWRAFHAGRFAQAVETADACGLLGAACANKATGVYATYLESSVQRQQACFESAIQRASFTIECFPGQANSHYFHAYNLGRLSQSMSIVDALRQGLGGKIQDSLKLALSLQADHAEAHTAAGLYHAEVINKVGKMIGSMTYGASAREALEHFETALQLNPDSPIAHIEFANGLYLLYGERELDRVTELYVEATGLTPRDAMERLDIEAALTELE